MNERRRFPWPRSWVEVVGYGHEVVHTGVLAALLESDGPRVAAELTGRGPEEIAGVSDVRREASLEGARGKADLVARLQLTDGGVVPLAVETKVHSDGSCDQLYRTTENSPGSEGVLLALGLTSLKLLRIHTSRVSETAGSRWGWVGPDAWLRILSSAAVDSPPPWLAPYQAAVEDWRSRLTSDQRALLHHLEWMNQVLEQLPEPDRWREIRTSRSGPLLSRFGWQNDRGNDVYLEFMGHADGRRDLRLKVGTGTPDELEQLAEQLWQLTRHIEWARLGRATRGRSKTVAKTEDLHSDIAAAVEAASTATGILNDRFA